MTDSENQNRSFFMFVLLKSTLTSECAYQSINNGIYKLREPKKGFILSSILFNILLGKYREI